MYDTASMEIIIMTRESVKCFTMHVASPEMIVGHFQQHSSVTVIGYMKKKRTFKQNKSFMNKTIHFELLIFFFILVFGLRY